MAARAAQEGAVGEVPAEGARDQLYQGDVGLIPVPGPIPARAVPVPRDPDGAVVLARFDPRRHRHAIFGGGRARLFRTRSAGFLEVGPGAPVTLAHEEHAPVEVAPGRYRVVVQCEWDAGGARPAGAIDVGGRARALLARMERVDLTTGATLDRAAVERAFRTHRHALGLPPLPIRWGSVAGCPRAAAAWSATAPASVPELAARLAAAAAEPAGAGRWIGLWLPSVDAAEACLWLFWVEGGEAAAVAQPAPALRAVGAQLHRAAGPAVSWPTGARHWFWRGVQVPRDLAERPEAITVARIAAEPDARLRRVMIERYGYNRYLDEVGAERLHADGCGVLWRQAPPGREPLVLVEVRNGTAGADGTRKRYVIPVHPELRPLRRRTDGTIALGPPQRRRTARAAVASGYGLRESEYRLLVRT